MKQSNCFKTHFVKFTALMLSVITVFTVIGCTKGKRSEDALSYDAADYERADISMKDAPYEPFDSARLFEAIAEMTDLADTTTESDSVTKAQKEAYAAAFETMNEEYDIFVSTYYRAMVESYMDLSDEEKSAEVTLLDALSVEVSDKLTVALGRTIASPLEDTLLKLHGSDNILIYEGNTESDEYLNSLLIKEAALEQTYDELSVRNYTSYPQMNETLGSVIVELVQVRNKIAERCGYDNYVDYAFSEVYYRDYTPEDYNRVTGYIKSYLLQTEEDLDELVYYNYNSYKNSGIDLKEALYELSASDELSPMMSDALRYMYKHELYVFTEEETSLNEAFSAKFYDINEPFIYVYLTDSAYDVSNLLHESGHFISYFVSKASAFEESFCSLEIAETQSLGFHLLFSDIFSDIYPEYGDLFEINAVSDALYSLVWVSWRTDLEHELYTTEDLTLEKANKIAGRLSDEYNLGISNKNGEVLYWVSIPHIATSAVYQVSYVMSALSAMGLWQESLSDEEEAQGKLEGIMLLDSTATYRQMLSKFDLEYVLEEKFFKNLSGLINKRFLQ